MEIKCIITDDEPIARKGLRRHIGKIDFLTIVGECEDAIQLNNMLNSVQADLLFLDIEMPGMDGFSMAGKMQKSYPNIVLIFVSSHESLVFQSYEYDRFWFMRKSALIADLKKAIVLSESLSRFFFTILKT